LRAGVSWGEGQQDEGTDDMFTAASASLTIFWPR
jgi:hypothetical protein